ncbi:hypothetical protein BGZ81_006006 [Podila clonocystis]|nr:hypothetical protein BGZ81_006006 [Podila clonocystis]
MIDTPELVFLVGQHLHPADLRRCIEVSQLWREILIPCLWRELDDSERPWYQMFEEAEILLSTIDDGIDLSLDMDPRRRLSELIHEYGHHIRRLRITHIWTLECCLQANLNGITMLYWRIDIRECKYIHLDGPREVAIIQGLPSHLECEPDPCRVGHANEWDYVSRCFWALVSNNCNLTLVDMMGTRNKLLKLKSTEEVLYPLLGSLPWLRTLTNLPIPSESIPQLKTFAPNLSVLNVAGLVTAFDFLTVATAETVHHHLRSLTLYGDFTLYQVCNIFQTFPNLENAQLLPLYKNNQLISRETQTQIITHPIHFESTRLRQLGVSHLDWALSSPDLLNMRFPALESVQITNLEQFRCLSAFLTHCPKIRSVQIDLYSGPWTDSAQPEQQDASTDEDIEPLILANVRVLCIDRSFMRTSRSESLRFLWRSIPHLVELSLVMSTPPLLAALAQCCVALQRVNLGSVYTPWNGGHSNVVEILTSCSELRTLEGVGLKIGPNEFRNGGTWVCHKIAMLQLEITGLGGETSEQECEKDDNDNDEKYTLQHVVYDQLAQLTRLQRLDLSVVCACNVFPYVPAERFVYLNQCHRHRHMTISVAVRPLDTLQFTLASGLERLSGLSRLEELGVRGVDHRIRRDELSWMQVHWPRLKWIRGVAAKIEEEQTREVQTWYVEDGMPDFLERYPDHLEDLFGED